MNMPEDLPAFTHVMLADANYNVIDPEPGEGYVVNGTQYPIVSPRRSWVGPLNVLYLRIDVDASKVLEASILVGLEYSPPKAEEAPRDIAIEFTAETLPWKH